MRGEWETLWRHFVHRKVVQILVSLLWLPSNTQGLSLSRFQLSSQGWCTWRLSRFNYNWRVKLDDKGSYTGFILRTWHNTTGEPCTIFLNSCFGWELLIPSLQGLGGKDCILYQGIIFNPLPLPLAFCLGCSWRLGEEKMVPSPPTGSATGASKESLLLSDLSGLCLPNLVPVPCLAQWLTLYFDFSFFSPSLPWMCCFRPGPPSHGPLPSHFHRLREEVGDLGFLCPSRGRLRPVGGRIEKCLDRKFFSCSLAFTRCTFCRTGRSSVWLLFCSWDSFIGQSSPFKPRPPPSCILHYTENREPFPSVLGETSESQLFLAAFPLLHTLLGPANQHRLLNAIFVSSQDRFPMTTCA